MPRNTDIFGPGNTTGTSFRDVLHGTSAAGQATVTQADNLPDIIQTQLHRVDPKARLSSIDQWEDWHAMIKSMLGSHDLHDVIDWSMPEPAPTDANAQRWYDASIAVRSWLMAWVDAELIWEVKARGKSIDFAHEFMRELTLVINCEVNVALEKAYFAIERCRRNDYTTVTGYLAEMTRRVVTAHKLSVPITPWVVWIRILDALSKIPSLGIHLAFYRQDTNEREELTDMTLGQLLEYITMLCTVTRNRDLDEEKVINRHYCSGFHP